LFLDIAAKTALEVTDARRLDAEKVPSGYEFPAHRAVGVENKEIPQIPAGTG
jgi:hypothetical protein